MPSNAWDEARNAEIAMLFAVIKNEGKANFTTVASQLGEGFTEAGVRQKFYKLKRESEKLLSGDGAAAAPAPPATPASGTKATDKTPKSSIGKRKGRASADPEADDDNAATATPSKKTKKTTAAKIKKENKKDDEVKTEATDATNGNGVEGTANGAAEGDEVEANKVANKNGI